MIFGVGLMVLTACGAKKAPAGDVTVTEETVYAAPFEADSAMSYLVRQVDFGPRVPNTSAHRAAGAWLASELKRHGAEVTEQRAELKAFDGTRLQAVNIFGQYNPSATDRTLLLAHWDCRPWADQDADPANHNKPVDGANDGASGVAVLLEIARQLNADPLPADKGVDILFVDAEDWGSEGQEDSWALGTRYFVNNPPVRGYRPSRAILLDMVGGREPTFCREYFSEQSAPGLANKIWATAAKLGYGEMFPNRMGSAVTDDHVQLIEAGIPAVDIIEYNPANGGFNPVWHTAEDNVANIDPATLGAVGKTVHSVIRD